MTNYKRMGTETGNVCFPLEVNHHFPKCCFLLDDNKNPYKQRSVLQTRKLQPILKMVVRGLLFPLVSIPYMDDTVDGPGIRLTS